MNVYRSRQDGVNYLGHLLRRNTDHQFAQMVNDGPSVHRHYGQLFHPDNVVRLTEVEFKEFLLYEHNRHWWGIHRHQAKLVANMDRLRSVLGMLVNEDSSIKDRIDRIEPANGPKPLPGLGKAVFTPVLHGVYPRSYGVWNSVSESAMKRLQLWPTFAWGSTYGDRYFALNETLNKVAEAVGIDLWILDSLWWLTELQHEPQKHQLSGNVGSSSSRGRLSSPRRVKPRDTFICTDCFLTKSISLRSTDPDRCLDCRPG